MALACMVVVVLVLAMVGEWVQVAWEEAVAMAWVQEWEAAAMVKQSRGTGAAWDR